MTKLIVRRSPEGKTAFRDEIDRLVCLSIFQCKARQYGVIIRSISFSRTGTSEVLSAGSREVLATAVNCTVEDNSGNLFSEKAVIVSGTGLLTVNGNYRHGTSGKVLRCREDDAFWRAPVQARTKKPGIDFSRPCALTHSVNIVRNAWEKGKPLKHSYLERTFGRLCGTQRKLLSDYIERLYCGGFRK